MLVALLQFGHVNRRQNDEILLVVDDRRQAFEFAHQNFMDLLARTDSPLHQLDVRQTGILDQHLGEVDDPASRHRHDENFPADAFDRRFEQQGNGVGKRKEKTRHIHIGDRDFALLADLILEQVHDAAVRSQHVAAPHRNEAGSAAQQIGVNDQLLADGLRHPVKIGRIGGFIR